MGVNEYFEIAGLIVLCASTVAAITPTPRDDTFLGWVYKLVDLAALNILKAKDK
jgi:hypothetical protein